MKSIVMTLDFPPSVNRYWRSRLAGGVNVCQHVQTYKSEAAHDYEAHVAAAFANSRQTKIHGRLRVQVTLHPPTRRSCDIDNYVKSLLDAMEAAGVYDDDGQIDQLNVYRGRVVKGGLCEVVVANLEPEEEDSVLAAL